MGGPILGESGGGSGAVTGLAATGLGLLRIGGYLAVTVPLTLIQAFGLLAGMSYVERLPVFYHRLVCWMLGFRIDVVGERSSTQPTLFVANHVSYLDVEMLGSLIPGCFVAKSDVRDWPVFGWLARLQRTVFVDRRVRSTTAQQRDSMTGRLQAGTNLILFPEGTSSDGNRVLPFKSALFSAAEIDVGGAPLTVQPVSIGYTRLDGIPLGRDWRPFLAWYGDMGLAPHLWGAVRLGIVTVVVEFHRPVSIAEFGTRKRMAEHCHAVISAGLVAANSGRRQPVPAKSSPASPPVAAAPPARDLDHAVATS